MDAILIVTVLGLKELINPRIYSKMEVIAYLSPQILACTGCWRLQRQYGRRQGPRDFRFYGIRQGFGRCVFKLGSPLSGIEKMPHCFLVNRSVFFIPREDEALPTVQIFFSELRSHLPFCPARDDRPCSFVFVFVISVSAYHDQHVIF